MQSEVSRDPETPPMYVAPPSVNKLQNDASAQAISFALGETDNVHDLLIAEQKANLALQYTVAIRNQFISGYNTIMNMQI